MEQPIVDEMTPPKAESITLPMGRVVSFATITAAGFVLGQASGLIREMVVSASFGLSSGELDAYFIARLVPTLINNIVAGSAITAAVMPVFARYITSNERTEFWRAVSAVTNIVLLVALLLTALGMIFAQPIIALLGMGLELSAQQLAASLLAIMMPTLFLGALLNMAMASLNSLDRFIGPALIFIALNGGIILTVMVLATYIGIYSVAVGFLIGVALQVVIQFFELRAEHVRYFFTLDLRHPALRAVGMGFMPVMALAIVSQINLVIDRSMATGLPIGSVGALSYADTILGSFYSLGISLGIAVFPTLSRMAATNDMESTGRTITLSLRLLIFILAPLTFVIVAFPEPIVGVLLGRGKFDAGDVTMTAQALTMYAIGLMAVGAMNVLQRAFYALSKGSIPLIVGSAVIVVHILLNVLFIPTLGHAGIALSASLTTTIGAIVLIFLLARLVSGLDWRVLAVSIIQCVALAAIVAAGAWGIAQFMHLGTTTLSERLVNLGFGAVAGIAYFVMAWLLNMSEARVLWQTLGRFLPKRQAG